MFDISNDDSMNTAPVSDDLLDDVADDLVDDVADDVVDDVVGPAVSEVSVLVDGHVDGSCAGHSDELGFSVASLAPDLDEMLGEPDADLCVELVKLEGLRRRLDARRARVLATLDVDGTTDTEHGMRTGSWVAAVCSQPSGPSTTVVRHSKQLTARFGVLLEALETARISWAHIETILRVCNPRIIDNVVAIQTELLVLADRYTFDRWATEIIAICQMIDVDGGHDPTRNRKSSVKAAHTSDGMCHIDAWLTPDLAHPFLNTLDRIADRLWHQARSDIETLRGSHHHTCPRSRTNIAERNTTADSHTDTSTEAPCTCGGPDNINPADLELPSRSELRAAALAEMARLANGAMQAQHRNALADVTIVVHANPNDGTATFTLDDTQITEDTFRYLAPEATWRLMSITTTGEVLHLSRTVRTCTRGLRHALNIRDHGCVFPGCSAPKEHCDAHHVTHWADGGTTDIDNMCLLCRYHHTVTHRNHWNMTATNNQRFAWTTPTGRVIHSQQHHQHRHHPPDAEP